MVRVHAYIQIPTNANTADQKLSLGCFIPALEEKSVSEKKK